MVTGDNKGHVYEKKIVAILKEKNLIPSGLQGAGSGPGSDILFKIQHRRNVRPKVSPNS